MPSDKETLNSKSALTIFVVLILSLLLTIFLTWPKIKELKDKSTEMEALKAEKLELDAKISALEDAKSQIAAAKKSIETLDLAIPPDDGMPEILVSLENMVSRAGLSLNQLTPISQGEETASSETKITVSSTGSFQNIISLYQLFEKNIRPIKFNSVSLTTSGDKGDVSSTFELSLLSTPKTPASESGGTAEGSAAAGGQEGE